MDPLVALTAIVGVVAIIALIKDKPFKAKVGRDGLSLESSQTGEDTEHGQLREGQTRLLTPGSNPCVQPAPDSRPSADPGE
jgi:hypothetical protein